MDMDTDMAHRPIYTVHVDIQFAAAHGYTLVFMTQDEQKAKAVLYGIDQPLRGNKGLITCAHLERWTSPSARTLIESVQVPCVRPTDPKLFLFEKAEETEDLWVLISGDVFEDVLFWSDNINRAHNMLTVYEEDRPDEHFMVVKAPFDTLIMEGVMNVLDDRDDKIFSREE